MAPVSRLRLSQRRKTAGSTPQLGAQPSELWLDRTQFHDLTRQHDEEAATMPRPADTDPDDLGTPIIPNQSSVANRASATSVLAPCTWPEPVSPTTVTESGSPAPTAGPAATGSHTTAEAQNHTTVEAQNQPAPATQPAAKQRLTGWAVACGAAALIAGGTAWAVFAGSPSEPAPAVAAGASILTAPMAQFPPPAPVDNAIANAPVVDPAVAAPAAPAEDLSKPAVKDTRAPAAAVADTRSAPSTGQIVRRPKPPAVAPPSPPREPMTPEEAYRKWSAAFEHKGTRWNPFQDDYPPHR